MNPSDTRIGSGDFDTHCIHLFPGQKVRIHTGTMAGIAGTVVDLREGGRVLLRMQHGLYVEIQQNCLQSKDAKEW